MKEHAFHISYALLAEEELGEEDRRLIERAKEATATSYAPYSGFHVGAAALLDNGETVCGSNQENAASPSGICAERCAVFYAGARFPESGVKTLAIAARGKDGRFTRLPISPCGSCRQVLSEAEDRRGQAMRVLLYGTAGVYVLEGIDSLLPFRFGGDALNARGE